MCRAAAMEMPRPTVRRWCEHGYSKGFEKTVSDLRTHFVRSQIEEEWSLGEELSQEEPISEIPDTDIIQDSTSDSIPSSINEIPDLEENISEVKDILATIPVTLDDKPLDLIVYKGQNPELAVVEFCRDNMPNDINNCVKQLLPNVLDQLDSASNN